MRRRLDEEDRLRIVRYLDSDMVEEEMFVLEMRLSSEPELADAFEEFERMDILQRRHVITRSVDEILAKPTAKAPTTFTRSSRIRRAWTAVAAAAIIGGVAALFGWFHQGQGPLLPFDVAVLESEATLEEYNRHIGKHSNWIPAGNDHRSGPRAPDAPSAKAYYEQARRAETARANMALSNPVHEARAGRFVLVLRLAESAAVLLVGIEPGGRSVRLFPDPSTTSFPIFAGDAVHVLPRPSVLLPVDWRKFDHVDFDNGFNVPLGAGRFIVLVAVRKNFLSAGMLGELDALLESNTGSAPAGDAATWAPKLRAWLEKRDFAVREIIILEPS